MAAAFCSPSYASSEPNVLEFLALMLNLINSRSPAVHSVALCTPQAVPCGEWRALSITYVLRYPMSHGRSSSSS
eukprot:scaffold13725_cov44-Cyclotella_meneghiniana.AAC.9